MTKMQPGDRDELSAQIREYDTCFAEFLKPFGNGQKILQAILLREAFSPFCAAGCSNKATCSNSGTGRKLWPW
jgi:hypothetical protein